MGDITSIDPRTGTAVETVATETTAAQAREICARSATATAALSALSITARATLLDAMANVLDEHRDRLVALADRESALGTARLDGELTRTANQLRLFAAVLRDGSYLEATIDHLTAGAADMRRMLVSLGPVAVFGASNFPFAFSAAGGDTASALAAGSAVVVKAHGAHPALDAAVVALLRAVCRQEGVDEDAVAIVFGREAGRVIVDDPHIQAVGFTGSESAGRMLMDIAAARPQPIPVYAEMGSLNPLVVSPGSVARGQALGETIAQSVLLGSGQFCTKPGLVFVPRGEGGDALVSTVTQTLTQSAPAFLLTAAIRDSFVSNVASIASVPAATVLVSPDAGEGSAVTPALNSVDSGALRTDAALLTESFGPGALVVRYDDTAGLVDALRDIPGSLTLSLFAEADEQGLIDGVVDVAADRVGRIIFGGVPTGVAVNWAQHHGGPYPAAASAMHTSVGASAIRRFLRPLSYQGFPDRLLPEALQDENPLGIPRRVDGRLEVPTP